MQGKEYKKIYIRNTLSGEKELFKPIEDGKVRMYNCGPTVYSEQHIGNMRAGVFADSLRRMFEYAGYTVKQVINITDVGHLTSDADTGEDKMEKRAKERGERAQDIAKHITEIYMHDLQALGVDTDAILFPRATEYIDTQIKLTETLIEKGYAYVIDRGVAFDITRFKDYGKLGNINVDDLRAGSRVEADTQKRHPADFWLWKLSDTPGVRQQEWDSPWGVGFPGWHIECTAMSRALLGKQLDVHTGGIEHIPVHHNNEIAQSEALTGKKFVNYWMHNAHLLLDGKKLSKSNGHVVYLRQIVDRGYNPLALRYLFLSAHYASEQNFTWEALDAAQTALRKLRRIYVQELKDAEPANKPDSETMERFSTALCDDLGTPKALAVLWDSVKSSRLNPSILRITLEHMLTTLGLSGIITDTESKKLTPTHDDTPDEVLQLLKQRKEARKQRDWTRADALREQVAELGYKITDNGTEQELERIS